jgi:hypothetical protein
VHLLELQFEVKLSGARKEEIIREKYEQIVALEQPLEELLRLPCGEIAEVYKAQKSVGEISPWNFLNDV